MAKDNGIGVVGVASGARLWAVKIGSGGYAQLSDKIAGIDWVVVRRNEIEVANMSVGRDDEFSEGLRGAIAAVVDAGIVFVAAAGIAAGVKDVTPFYPAGYILDNMVAVSATDSVDARAGFSNYGAGTVGLGAPGVGIQSTVPNGGYSSLNGTSMASPHVAGAVGGCPISVATCIMILELYKLRTAPLMEGLRPVLINFCRNPLILSILTGFLLGLARIEIPAPLSSSLRMIGSTTSATAIFMLGVFLYGRKLYLLVAGF